MLQHRKICFMKNAATLITKRTYETVVLLRGQEIRIQGHNLLVIVISIFRVYQVNNWQNQLY